jgi:hypothetical protein
LNEPRKPVVGPEPYAQFVPPQRQHLRARPKLATRAGDVEPSLGTGGEAGLANGGCDFDLRQ